MAVLYHVCLGFRLQAAEEAAAESDDEEEPAQVELKPNPKLEYGKKLPPTLEEYFLPEHVGRPLEDIDEFYQNKKVHFLFFLLENYR